MTLLSAARGVGLATAGLTLLFLALDLTANRDLFLYPDLALGALLVGAALVPNPRFAALGLLVGFAYTAGVFSLSVAVAAASGSVNVSTTLGLAVAVLFVYLLWPWCLARVSP